jgi:hypothetical protein
MTDDDKEKDSGAQDAKDAPEGGGEGHVLRDLDPEGFDEKTEERAKDDETISDSATCPECGAPIENLRVTCPNCGKEYDEGDYDDPEAGQDFQAGTELDNDEGNKGSSGPSQGDSDSEDE